MHKPKDEVPVYLIERTAKKMRSAFKRLLHKHHMGINTEQWVVLYYLLEHDGATQKEIGDDIYKDPPSLTRIIDKLEEMGLVERKSNLVDRRKTNVFLTQKGREKILGFLPMVKSYRQKTYRYLTDRDIAELTRLLDRIYHNVL